MYNMRNVNNINYDTAFGLFAQLNNEELKALLNDETKLEEIVKDDKQCKDLEKEKEMLLVSNRSLAEFNLSKEPVMVVLKTQLQELSENCERLYKLVEEKYNDAVDKVGVNSLNVKLSLLQMSAAEMEEKSEALSESFLNGETEVEEFLEQFTSRRKIMHLHKVKADKMAEIISQQNQLTENAISYNLPPSNFNGGIRYGY